MSGERPQHTVFRPEPCDPASVQISVIIPAYNMGSLLVDTLQSVFAQTVAPHEIIVVNNGSTDDTEQLVAPFRDRITYIHLDPNQGVSRARNAGAEKASGNWFLFLDGDDRLFPAAIEAFRDAAARGGAGAVVGRVEQLTLETGERRERTFSGITGEPPEPARRNFWRSVIASPGAALFHREVHERIDGFTKPWQPTEDRDYYIRAGMTTPFAFFDAMVLEKLYRANSMRKFSDIGVFWGMKVHFEFLDWCKARELDTDFLNTSPLGIVRHALQRAFGNRDVDVIDEILAYAAERDVTLPLGLRVNVAWFRLLGTVRKALVNPSRKEQA